MYKNICIKYIIVPFSDLSDVLLKILNFPSESCSSIISNFELHLTHKIYLPFLVPNPSLLFLLTLLTEHIFAHSEEIMSCFKTEVIGLSLANYINTQ